MEELVDGLRNRDEAAFKKVMELFKNKIYNYLRLMTNDDQLAEELTQDTFVKVYFKGHTIKTGNLRAWIYTIATNLARSEFRKRKVKAMFSIGDVAESHFSYLPTLDDEIEVQQMIASLPEKYRVPIIMKEIDRFSFEEIAQIMDKPVGTVKTLVFRAKNHLRKSYSETGQGLPGTMEILKRSAKNESF